MLTFPPRNLPPSASAWGRTVENELRGNESRSEQLDGSFQNWSRSVGGSLAVIGSQIEELYNRFQISVAIPNITTTLTIPPSGTATPSGSYSFTVSSLDGEPRSSNVFISGSFFFQGTSNTFSNLGVQLEGGGSVTRRSGFAPFTTSAPAGWTGTFSATSRAVIGTNTPFILSFSGLATNIASNSETLTVGLSDIRFNVVFGEKT